MKDYFTHKAGSYDADSRRSNNVENIANAILSTVNITADLHIMDFGSGTGLLLQQLAPHVSKITAVDVSEAMNRQLAAKAEGLPCELEMKAVNLETQSAESAFDGRFDGIVSSMTMHHIADIGAMFETFAALLKPGAFIAIADLDSEDGSFHTDDTGVKHLGFERDWFKAQAEAAGFEQVQTKDASVVEKDQGRYPVFLLTAQKRS